MQTFIRLINADGNGIYRDSESYAPLHTRFLDTKIHVLPENDISLLKKCKSFIHRFMVYQQWKVLCCK